VLYLQRQGRHSEDSIFATLLGDTQEMSSTVKPIYYSNAEHYIQQGKPYGQTIIPHRVIHCTISQSLAKYRWTYSRKRSAMFVTVTEIVRPTVIVSKRLAYYFCINFNITCGVLFDSCTCNSWQICVWRGFNHGNIETCCVTVIPCEKTYIIYKFSFDVCLTVCLSVCACAADRSIRPV